MLRTVRRHWSTLVTLLIFSAAAALLVRELRHYSYAEVLQTVQRIPAINIALAVGLTVFNYASLTAYDFLALRAIGRRLPAGKVLFTSFVAYAASNNFGVLLGGSAVRYRLYSQSGFSASDVVRIMANLSLTFWVGRGGLPA